MRACDREWRLSEEGLERFRVTFTAVVVCILMAGPGKEAVRGEVSSQKQKEFREFQGKYHKLQDSFSASVEKLIRVRDEAGEAGTAELKKLIVPVDHEELRGRKLSKTVLKEPGDEMPAEERGWRMELRNLQKEQATALFQLAKQGVQKRFVSFAFDLLREALWHDPDHAGARRIFGYKQIDESWLTNFEAEMRRKKFEWSEKYGWLPVEFVGRYENGERNFQGKWMSAAREEELRKNFRNSWVIRTEHFEIRTNVSLEKGVELAKELEEFQGAFYATFAGSFTPREQLSKLLEGGTANSALPRPHRVHYFRTREEYLKTCQPKMPVNIGITLGLYIPGDQVSYFFQPEDPEANVLRTVFHEATHQLFSETRPSRQPIAVQGNFWIVEGIACYMESFEQTEEGFVLGDPSYVRFQNARDRRLGRKEIELEPYYRPLVQFTAMGQDDYQRDPQQRANYSQGAGLAHFFMHFQEGLYRDDFIEHLSEVYSQASRTRAAPRSLEELTEVPYGELDRQYGDYLRDQAARIRVTAPDVPPAPEPEDVSGAGAGEPEGE